MAGSSAEQAPMPSAIDELLLTQVVSIVESYLAQNQLPSVQLPALIKIVHASLRILHNSEKAPDRLQPAVPVGKSVTDTYIVCLEDGKRLRMLKRYIGTRFGLSPDQYRRKWALPAAYPMVAPSYARLRSAFAKKSGLGKVPVKRKRMSLSGERREG